MSPKLKKLSKQVVVITGASSGIGLATAKLAAKKGAKLVLFARSQDALRTLCDEINSAGGQAVYQAGDVANPESVTQLADFAVSSFGRIDTWINNAGVPIFGRLTEVHLEEKRRLFDVNFWGVVNGCRAAVPELRKQGGALINIGSVVSDRALPLQGIYSASKQAVKGYTDALRMELEEAGDPISVTLVKPTSINTPYLDHARNRMDFETSLPPPVYAPDVAAEAILYCAEHPRRDVIVGGGGKFISVLEMLAPRLADYYMEKTLFKQQQRGEKGSHHKRPGDLEEASGGGPKEGPYPGHVMRSSLYTKASLHPFRTLATLSVLAAGAFYLLSKAPREAIAKKGVLKTALERAEALRAQIPMA